MKKHLILSIIILALTSSCQIYLRFKRTYRVDTVDNNVCKKLKGDVVLYAIFVDSKATVPWTEYDIKSTLDSINKSKEWLEEMASVNGIDLKVNVQCHQNKKIIPISMNFPIPYNTLSGTFFSLNGISKLDKWSDKIAKNAGTIFPVDTSSVIKTKIRISEKEHLISRIRNKFKSDNVVLMYFINNYYKEELSVTLNTASLNKIEYCIVSFKNPAVIAHEFLHAFGAIDFYIGPFDRRRSLILKKEALVKEYPNEIMAITHKDICKLEISSFTKYLIGWNPVLEEKWRGLFYGKKIKVLKY